MIRNTDIYMEKRYSLFEIKARVENLKKKFGREYVNATIRSFKTFTSNELDLLYLTYYHIKDVKVRYNRYQFGKKAIIDYEPSGDIWNTLYSSWGLNGNVHHNTFEGQGTVRYITQADTDAYANVLYTYM